MMRTGRLTNGVERLTGRSIWMVDSTDLTVDQIQQIATRLQLAHPEIALVVVDYRHSSKLKALHDMTLPSVRCQKDSSVWLNPIKLRSLP